MTKTSPSISDSETENSANITFNAIRELQEQIARTSKKDVRKVLDTILKIAIWSAVDVTSLLKIILKDKEFWKNGSKDNSAKESINSSSSERTQWEKEMTS